VFKAHRNHTSTVKDEDVNLSQLRGPVFFKRN